MTQNVNKTSDAYMRISAFWAKVMKIKALKPFLFIEIKYNTGLKIIGKTSTKRKM